MIDTMKLALEALESLADYYYTERVKAAMSALRLAIEQAEKQEPVALPSGTCTVTTTTTYAAPPQRQPLNWEPLRELWRKEQIDWDALEAAVKAAYGIGEAK